jgi:hypothetical protein
MSKKLYLVTTAALFASVAAFGQTNNTNGPSGAETPAATAPAAAAPAETAPDAGQPAADAPDSGKMAKPVHHHAHGMRSAKANTDEDADKLNACMPDATPTADQMKCIDAAAKKS